MTTATAQLTALKFDATRGPARALRKGHRYRRQLARRASRRVGVLRRGAALCVGATAAYVASVAPRLARRHPAAQGYLNGNRQRACSTGARSWGARWDMPRDHGDHALRQRRAVRAHRRVRGVRRAQRGAWRRAWDGSPRRRSGGRSCNWGARRGSPPRSTRPSAAFVRHGGGGVEPAAGLRVARHARRRHGGGKRADPVRRQRRKSRHSSLVISDPDSSTGWSPSDLPLIRAARRPRRRVLPRSSRSPPTRSARCAEAGRSRRSRRRTSGKRVGARAERTETNRTDSFSIFEPRVASRAEPRARGDCARARVVLQSRGRVVRRRDGRHASGHRAGGTSLCSRVVRLPRFERNTASRTTGAVCSTSTFRRCRTSTRTIPASSYDSVWERREGFAFVGGVRPAHVRAVHARTATSTRWRR